MSDTTGFPLFDPNGNFTASSRHVAERFSSSTLDPDARERLAAIYREQGPSDEPTAAEHEPRTTAPEGLDSLLSRASSEAAAHAPTPELSPEELVQEALAAVQSGNRIERPAAVEAEAQEDVQELLQEICREQSLAEINEVAQNFVAEQTGELVQAAEPEAEPTCGSPEQAQRTVRLRNRRAARTDHRERPGLVSVHGDRTSRRFTGVRRPVGAGCRSRQTL